MTVYDPERHELLLLKWYLDIKANPEELGNLFTRPIQSLTEILSWAKYRVKISFEFDAQGIWALAWAEPLLDGAMVGGWARKDKRASFHTWISFKKFTQAALGTYPVIIGLTRQAELHGLHIKLGYNYVGDIPALFDGSPVRVYTMSRQEKEHTNGIRRIIEAEQQ